MTDNHAGFVKRLLASRHAMFVVAEWLSEKGFDVRLPAIKARRHDQKIEDFVDDGDIFISKDGSPERRVEVKNIRHEFTGVDDYPYKNVIIANKASFDRGNDNLSCFIIIGKDLNNVIIVNEATMPHWEVLSVTPKNTGNLEHFYACDKTLLKFRRLRGET
jgi:hypothetical protein